MAHTVGNLNQSKAVFSLPTPRLGRLIAMLAVLDLSIWSYVAIAVQVTPAAQPPSVKIALQLPQP